MRGCCRRSRITSWPIWVSSKMEILTGTHGGRAVWVIPHRYH